MFLIWSLLFSKLCHSYIFSGFWGKFMGVFGFLESIGMNESAKVAHHDASVVFTQKTPNTFFHLTPVCLLSSFPLDQLICISLPFILHCVWYPTPWMRNTISLSIFFFSSPTNSFESIAFDFKYVCVCVFLTYLAEIFRNINMKYKFFMATLVCGYWFCARLQSKYITKRGASYIYKSVFAARKLGSLYSSPQSGWTSFVFHPYFSIWVW